jgi:DNA-binding transcriptional ArsR family regulator
MAANTRIVARAVELYALHGICLIVHTGPVLSTFEVLAQPIRRSMLDCLRDGEHLVGELAEALGLTQPLTSKHLRVLRDAGLVSVRVDGPRRWYRLRVEPLAELDDWLTPYRWMWESHLDRLGAQLDAMRDDEGDIDDQ